MKICTAFAEVPHFTPTLIFSTLNRFEIQVKSISHLSPGVRVKEDEVVVPFGE